MWFSYSWTLRKKIKEEFKSYNIVEISVKRKYVIDSLMTAISDNLEYSTSECKFLIPYTDTAISAPLHRNAVVLRRKVFGYRCWNKAFVGAKNSNNVVKNFWLRTRLIWQKSE